MRISTSVGIGYIKLYIFVVVNYIITIVNILLTAQLIITILYFYLPACCGFNTSHYVHIIYLYDINNV